MYDRKEEHEVTGYTDSDLAKGLDERKSTGGFSVW